MTVFGKEDYILPPLQSKGVHVHKGLAKFNEFSFKLLPNPLYSPDLIQRCYFLFQKLKKPLILRPHKFDHVKFITLKTKRSSMEKTKFYSKSDGSIDPSPDIVTTFQ